MNCRFRLIALMLCIATGWVAQGQAPDFAWSSPRSMALGGVGTTGFEDPSTMHLNPAALMETERFSITTGLGASLFNGSFDSPGGAFDADTNMAWFPSISTAINFGSRLVAAGFSLNTFDYRHVEFTENRPNRYQGTEWMLYSGGFDFALGFMPIRDWAFGFKIGYLTAHAEWDRMVN
ncbi:hypothetical protein JXA80_02730, partial [bacterium]|nr:hypothetical protein [candidate division CSSED10-310 bacterium]